MPRQKLNLILDIEDDDDNVLLSGDPYLPKPIDNPDEYLSAPKEDKFWVIFLFLILNF